MNTFEYLVLRISILIAIGQVSVAQSENLFKMHKEASQEFWTGPLGEKNLIFQTLVPTSFKSKDLFVENGQLMEHYSNPDDLVYRELVPQMRTNGLAVANKNESKLLYLFNRINQSYSNLDDEPKLVKADLVERSSNVQSATTTARPAYDQIPRPLLFNKKLLTSIKGDDDLDRDVIDIKE